MTKTEAIRAFHFPVTDWFNDEHMTQVRPDRANEVQVLDFHWGRELSFPLGLILKLMCSCSLKHHV